MVNAAEKIMNAEKAMEKLKGFIDKMTIQDVFGMVLESIAGNLNLKKKLVNFQLIHQLIIQKELSCSIVLEQLDSPKELNGLS